jgi:hypothetical protein
MVNVSSILNNTNWVMLMMKSQAFVNMLPSANFNMFGNLFSILATNPEALNPYVYVWNNPIRYFDFLGLTSCKDQAWNNFEKCIINFFLPISVPSEMIAAAGVFVGATAVAGGELVLAPFEIYSFYHCYNSYNNEATKCKTCNQK